MVTAGEGSTGQRALEDSCGLPMPLEGATGIKRRIKGENKCIIKITVAKGVKLTGFKSTMDK